MSKTLFRRIARLEHHTVPLASGVVMIPWHFWFEGDEAALDREILSHPEGRLFIPGQAPSLEAWEAAARTQQAGLKTNT